MALKDEGNWYVVIFAEKSKEDEVIETVECVPDFWLRSDGTVCMWPPYEKNNVKIVKAIASRESPDISWKIYEVKKVYWASICNSYETARIKAEIAQDTSDFDTEYEKINDKSFRKNFKRKVIEDDVEEEVRKTKSIKKDTSTLKDVLNVTMQPPPILLNPGHTQEGGISDSLNRKGINLIAEQSIKDASDSDETIKEHLDVVQDEEDDNIFLENAKSEIADETDGEEDNQETTVESKNHEGTSDLHPDDDFDQWLRSSSSNNSSSDLEKVIGEGTCDKPIEEIMATVFSSAITNDASTADRPQPTVKKVEKVRLSANDIKLLKDNKASKVLTSKKKKHYAVRGDENETDQSARKEDSYEDVLLTLGKKFLSLEQIYKLSDTSKLAYIIMLSQTIVENQMKQEIQPHQSVSEVNDALDINTIISKKFPIKSVEQFVTFNDCLGQNNEFKQKIKNFLSTISGKNGPKAARAMLRRLIRDEVAAQYSFKGQGEKHCFSDTAFYILLEDFAARVSKTKDREDIRITVSTWLKNASTRINQKLKINEKKKQSHRKKTNSKVCNDYKDARVKAKIGETHSDIDSYYRMLFDPSMRKDRSKKEFSSTEEELNLKNSFKRVDGSQTLAPTLPQVLLDSNTVKINESEYANSNLIKSVKIVHPASSNKNIEGTEITINEKSKEAELTSNNTNYVSSPSHFSQISESEKNDEDRGTIDYNEVDNDIYSSTSSITDSENTVKKNKIKSDKTTTKNDSTVVSDSKKKGKERGSQNKYTTKDDIRGNNFPTTTKEMTEKTSKSKVSIDYEELKQLNDSEKLDYLIVAVHHLNENLAKLQMQIKNLNRDAISSVSTQNENFSNVMEMQSRFKLKTVEQMNLLDSKINDDKDFRNNLLKYLETIGGSSNDIVRNMLRTCITNELAAHYSYQGKKEKLSFADTKLHKIIRDTAIKVAQYDRNKVKTEAQIWLKNAPQRLQKEKDETNKSKKKRKNNDKVDVRNERHKIESSTSSN